MPPRSGISKPYNIESLKGGRNGADSPHLIPNDQCLEALNVDWNVGGIGRKRPGADSVALTGGTAFTAPLNFVARHLPSADETTSEMWGIDAAATPIVKRLAGGTSWANVTMVDAISTRPQDTVGASFNGKFFLAFKSAVDRLHVYDPATANCRRTGLATSGTPTASTSGGAVTDTRTYKTAVTVQSGGVTLRRSELSAVSSSTGLTAQKATVTLVGAPGEGETHWELYGASTDGVYKIVGTATIGTATQDDNNATLTGTLAPLVGTNSLFPSVKYLAADENRILGATQWETGGKYSRVFFTPPFVNPGDDERNPQTTQQNYYVDLNENDGGFITGLAGPLQDSMWVFKYRQIWKLTATGSTAAPYDPTPISRVVGCIEHKSIVLGRDEHGQPSIYFLSAEGPYRVGSQGLQYMGRDVEDIWKTINLDATNKVCHGVYHAAIHQVWWWVATGTSNDPNAMIVYDTIIGHAVIYPVGDTPPTAGVRRGWAKWTGDLATCRCSTMFAATIAASMGRLQKPYAGFITSLKLLRGDSATATNDAGTAFQSYFQTKPYEFLKGQLFDVGEPWVMAKASQGVTIEVQYVADYGMETTRKSTVLTADGVETYVNKKLDGLMGGNMSSLALQIGDASAQSATWELSSIFLPVTPGPPLS